MGRKEKGTLETRWVGTLEVAPKQDEKEPNSVGWDLVHAQKWLGKTLIEFPWPGYQYMGPAWHTFGKECNPGSPASVVWIAKQHDRDIDYSRATNLRDKHIS